MRLMTVMTIRYYDLLKAATNMTKACLDRFDLFINIIRQLQHHPFSKWRP